MIVKKRKKKKKKKKTKNKNKMKRKMKRRKILNQRELQQFCSIQKLTVKILD